VTLVDRSDATAIVAITRGGKTARVLAALRPRVPIFAVTDRPEVARRLALSWGVVPELIDLTGDIDTVAKRIAETLVESRAVARSSTLVVVSVTPDLARGESNFLKVQRA
jgi:pyruvate kinase